MTVVMVPRVFGGTLILTVAPPPASPVPTLQVTAVFRDGKVESLHRDGKQEALHRDGVIPAGGR